MSQSINLPLPERLGFALLWFVLVSLPVFQQDFSVRYEFFYLAKTAIAVLKTMVAWYSSNVK